MNRYLLFTVLFFCTINLSSQSWTEVSAESCVDLVVHNNQLFMATENSGPFKSNDGKAWQSVSSGVSSNSGSAIASYGSTLFYGNKHSLGIDISVDNGTNWVGGSSGISSNTSNYPRWFYKFNSNYFCIMSANQASGGGVFGSTTGSNWGLSASGMSSTEIGYQMAELGGSLYLGTNTDLYKSTDGGASWTSARPGGAMLHNGMTEINGRWFLFTSFNLQYSDDNGVSWNILSTDIKGSTYCGVLQGNGDTLIAWTAGKGIFYSLDNGLNWNDFNGNLSNSQKMLLQDVVLFNNSLFLAIPGNGVFASNVSSTTKVPEISLKEKVKVYPNPMNDAAVFQLENTDSRVIQLKIIDTNGKVVLNETSNTGRLLFNRNNLPAGIYLYQVTDAKHSLLASDKLMIK